MKRMMRPVNALLATLLVAVFVPSLASPSFAGNACAARAKASAPKGAFSTTLFPEVDQDDGRVWGRSPTTYPPPFKNAVDSAMQIMAARSHYTKAKPPYWHIGNGAVEMLTDSLPQGANILSATMCIYVNSVQDADNRNLTADWYNVNTSTNGNNWNIDQSFYSKAPKTTALAADPLSNLVPGSYQNVPLDNATGVQDALDAGYSYVGIRFHVDGGRPTGKNLVYFSSQEGGHSPFMVVTYTQAG